MEIIPDDARRYMLHPRLARRWIRDGGVVIATGPERAGARATFDFAETVARGETLQVTFNLREVGRACKFLCDYAIYLWNCEREGDYILRGFSESATRAGHENFGTPAPRALKNVAPTCYAGRYPNLRLEVHDAEATPATAPRPLITTRLLLPQGMCAAIYQPGPASFPKSSAGRLISISTKEMA